MGGKMGKIGFKAPKERGLPRIPAVWLLAFLLAAGGAPAFAQEPTPTCAPVIARVVSLQGTVEVQRAGTANWLAVRRLDTSICAGDRLRTAPSSRAMLYVQPETLVRLDQHTTLVLQQSTDEISVEFSTDEVTRVACTEETCGAGYFITRFPKKFKVKTPHMNAAVEGTEFMVEMSSEGTKLTVLEGKVSSQSTTTGESQLVAAGQSLASGASGTSAIATVVKPQDAVQWVLRYPPISDAGGTDEGAGIARAEAALQVGRVDEALEEINGALANNPRDANALALRSVIQLAKNDKSAAMESARAATETELGNYRGWLALSYAQQATFKLEEALESAQRAQAMKADSSLLVAHVAELLLSLGDIRRAEEVARTAIANAPAESHARAILAFTHLAAIDTRTARSEFLAAIERDSFAPLARFGLGLAMIRDGELKVGREQLEIAVALDPFNSLLRSYVGKAYYEENASARDELAATQFELAKQLDIRDPTPWFYQAILSDSWNRPVDALKLLHESIARNDNRAVYRSSFLLDDDAAARGANVAAVYEQLGFERLAIIESVKALSQNAGNSSAHRQLASAYADVSRHDIARVSEALQAQIRQPVSLASVSPQLGSDNLLINRNTGPARPGQNEFNELFNRDDVRLRFDGIVGQLDTLGDEFVASALRGRVSYTLSQLHYETNGFVENDASVKDIYDLIVHGQLTPQASLQVNLKRSEFSAGQTVFPFDEFPTPTTIFEQSDTLRVSGHNLLSRGGSWIWTVVGEDRDRAVRSFPDGGLFVSSNAKPYAVEAQYTNQIGKLQLITGLGYLEEAERFVFENARIDNEAANAYAYAQWEPSGLAVSIQLGAAAEQFESTLTSDFVPEGDTLERSEFSPKAGLVWTPRPGTTVRAAAVSSLHRPFIRSQTIEPTQVAGFNQFFSAFDQFYGEFIGTNSRRIGLAVDQWLGSAAFMGVEIAKRRLEVPSFVFERDFNWHEESGNVYFYKTFEASHIDGRPAAWQASFSAEVEYEDIERPQVLTGAEGIMHLETIMAPLGIQLFGRSGTTIRLATSYVAQDGTFSIDVGLPIVTTDDEAWITDFSLEQRLPSRHGTVAIGVRNLFDESIELVEIDPVNPRVATKRFVFAEFNLNF